MHGIACGAVANSHCEELVSKSLCCVVGVEHVLIYTYAICYCWVWGCVDTAVMEWVVWLGWFDALFT